jgi:hypothetical protein
MAAFPMGLAIRINKFEKLVISRNKQAVISLFIYLVILILQINDLKRHYQAGGRSVFTWQKQPGDKFVTLIGAGLVTIGLVQLIPGHYRLATGTGKKE